MPNRSDESHSAKRDSDAVEMILNPARCRTKPNVYFLGPYGQRVSFASQQRRALNLVWALEQTQAWKDLGRPKVAIVGAGIAGLMAAAACVMRGCEVWLYEREDELLKLQKRTEHRTVHPSINFWPQEPLACTTVFPFMNWFPGKAEDVIRMMLADWKKFEKRLSGIQLYREVQDYEWDRTQVVIRFADGDSETADFVIVATGFGVEKNLGDNKQKPYWRRDKIDWIARQAKKQTCLVSGTGDGGLIDTLRLTFPDFMADQLAVELLRTVGDDIRDQTLRIETAAAKPDLADPYAYLDEQYRALARSLPDLAKDVLSAPRRHEIELVGQHPTPFARRAAPIHKLIVAHALNEELITYIPGSVKRSKGVYYLHKSGEAPQPIERDLIVIRHGTKDPLPAHWGKDRQHLRAEQEKIAHLLHLAPFSPEYFLARPEIYPRRNSMEFVVRHSPLAELFLLERHGVTVAAKRASAAANPEARSLGDTVIFEGVLDRQETPRDLARFPQSVFGIPIWLSPDIEDEAVVPVRRRW